MDNVQKGDVYVAKFICEFEGVYGRTMKLYDNKIVINTKKTVGSLVTGNFTDGEKTIFLCDVVGVQFKKSGLAIGYLQFETSSMQMNNKDSNFFSENTFTYENGLHGITNVLMEKVYSYVVDRIEEIKYGESVITKTPDFASFVDNKTGFFNVSIDDVSTDELMVEDDQIDEENYVDIICPKCGETISMLKFGESILCPWCDTEIRLN